MSKFYVSEQELKKIYDSQVVNGGWINILPFNEWLEAKKEEGQIELVEFNYYEVSKLEYRPIVKFVIGDSGNIFNLMGITKRALIASGKREKGNEMCSRVITQARNYDEAMLIIMEYVKVEKNEKNNAVWKNRER